MKILIAPDKFKDALDAADVAAALAAGVRSVAPDAEIVLCPLADGGEGTGRLLAQALKAQTQTAAVLDPLRRLRDAHWWLAPENTTGIIEMAEASGLCLLKPDERDALRTTSYGTGQLIRAAAHAGCEHVILCVGGSATVDGGAGCLQGLGWYLLDAAGRPIDEPVSGGTLPKVARIQPPSQPVNLAIDVLCDVTNPLLGPNGAATVFAPQKGARHADVRQLETALRHWADVLADFALRDLSYLPGTGAAGGLPAGLSAATGARLRAGFDEVAHRVGLRDKLAASDVVFTGEGRLDEQTDSGKVVSGVARLGLELGRPVVAFVGAASGQRAELVRRLSLRDLVVITPAGTPLDVALARTAENLREAAKRYAGAIAQRC